MKSWRLRETIPWATDQALAVFPELIRPLLYTRGARDELSARLFLEPDYERDLHDPYLLQDMARAVSRIESAFAAGEKIILFGDYDADGIPGTALLAAFFDRVNYSRYEVYIPDRHEEAYGLNSEAIRDFARNGVTLVITIDCGVSNHREIVLAQELGLDVIVTDHHTVPETLPPAYAIINPKRADDQYPYKMLCGAGVAFKLVQGLVRKLVSPRSSDLLAYGSARPLAQQISSPCSNNNNNWEKWLLDLVAIATVADMVPLTGENRALVHFGLIVLRRSPRPGILALCRVLKLHQPSITADDIAFLIGPRLNAASRMAHGRQAYRLLTTTDPAEARVLAELLENNNRSRKISVETVLAEVVASVEKNVSPDGLIIHGNSRWPLGVLGLAASRLVERYQCPVFLWSQNSRGEVKGSGRSGGNFDIVNLMRSAGGDNFFSNFGGHKNAGGFSLVARRLPDLRSRLVPAYRGLAIKSEEEELVLEAELSLLKVTTSTARTIDRLAPFGLENPKPIFLFRAIPTVTVRTFGRDSAHLELTLFDGEISRRAIGFFMSPAQFGTVLDSGRPLDLAATLEQSYFRGREELRLRIVDCRQTR